MGLGAQELRARKEGKKKRVHRVACRKRPSEAEVWGRVIDRVQSTVAGVRFIHLCDRGADNFDVFAHLFRKGDSWVIRAAQLTRKVRTSEGTLVKLSEVMNTAPVMGTYKLYVSANTKQTARWAQVEVRSTSVTLVRPRAGTTAFVLDNEIREIPTNVVQVQELDAPETPARKLVPSEWLEVLGQVLRNPRPLKTVRDFMRALASLGGFLCGKSDGEPGWKTIWRGLDTLLVAIRGYRAAVKRYG